LSRSLYLKSLGDGLNSNPELAISLDDIGGVSGISSTTMDGMSVIQDFKDTQKIKRTRITYLSLPFSFSNVPKTVVDTR
jgi:hypothetical protein